MILNVENLCISYHSHFEGKKQVGDFAHCIVGDLSFGVEQKEVVGLIGKSGCGKTTVAWTVMGMIQTMGGFAKGKISLGDHVIFDNQYQDIQRHWWKDLAIVPQASMSSFNPGLTMRQVFVETIAAHQKKPQKMDERCEELMDIVRLDREVLGYYPHEMSGGMKQRAAIALALVLRPQLLILDEATTGLDVLVEADILKTVREIQKQSEMAILMISHDPRITDAVCDRTIVLEACHE